MGRRLDDPVTWLWPEHLQELQDALQCSLALPVLFVDSSGRPLAACEELADFCRHFTRAIALSRPCLECGRGERPAAPSDESVPLTKPTPGIHHCQLGVMDVALPIIAGGEAIGCVITAQVQPIDSSTDHLDMGGAEAYAPLLARLPRRSPAEMKSIAAGLSVVASLLGTVGAVRMRNLRLAQRLREQSRWIRAHDVIDAVTSLPDRQRFCVVLEGEALRASRYGRNLSVAVLDIEGFCEINEEFGHDVGNAVLRAVADRLAGAVRQTDFVGRVGGDEFAILFPETARHEAMIALQRIASGMDDLNASGELPVEVRLSIGLVECASQTEDLLGAATAAAIQARGAGGVVSWA